MNDRKKEWSLILGGSKGLGLATAKKLARHGYNIIVVHRDRRSDLEQIQRDFEEIQLNGIRFLSFNADGTHPEKRGEIIEKLQNTLSSEEKIKVLVHSIAKGNLKPMQSDTHSVLSNQDFHLTLDAMAISLYDWTSGIRAAGLFAEDSRVIAFTSEGNTKAIPHYGAVSAAKAALEAIIRSIALEFAPLGIKANCVQAGVTETQSFAMIPNSDQIKKAALKRNPSGRLTQPEDVANVVYLLCTAEAKWITGTIIKADGGESLR